MYVQAAFFLLFSKYFWLETYANKGNLLKFSADDENSTSFAPYFIKPENMFHLIAKPAGNPASLKCLSGGNPVPDIKWLKDGKEIQIQNQRRQKFIFRFDHLTVADQGIYTCVVSNDFGIISFNFTLEVQERLPHRPIMMENFPSNQTEYIGDDATFECKFVSDLHPSVYWVKHIQTNQSLDGENNTWKLENDTRNLEVVRSTNPNATDPRKLIIENVTYEDAGKYSCIASNTMGTSARSAWLIVLPRPEKNGIYKILVAVGCSAVCLLLACIAYFHFKKKGQKMKSLSQPMHVYMKKKVVVVRQASGSSQALSTPIVKIQAHPFDPADESSVGTVSEYEISPDPSWEFPRENLRFGRTLGHGAFGQVMQAEAYGLLEPNKFSTVAVKMLKDGHTDQDMIDLMLEMEMMKTLRKHPHIINLLGCCTQNGPLYVIVEYAANGNLRDYLRSHRPSSGYEIPNTSRELISERNLISFAYQIAKGMEYLASQKCIHRDLAARNILVMEDKSLKIGDFGFARDIHESDYYRKKKNGLLPIKWMALESLIDRLYTTQSDVWSFGVLLWEIMTLGGVPYASIPHEKLIQTLKSGHRLEKPSSCPLDIYLLMLQCWNANPSDRPKFCDIVQSLENFITNASDVEYLCLGYEYEESSDETSDDSGTDV